MRTRKESTRARSIHQLVTAEEGTCQDMKRKGRTKGTHVLKTAEGGTCKNTERKRPSEDTNQLETAEGELSEHGKKATTRSEEHPLPGDSEVRDL